MEIPVWTIVVIIIIGLFIGMILQTVLTVIIRSIWRNRQTRRLKNIVFDKEVLAGFDNWLAKSITMYMTRYISEKAGKELIKDEELNINSDFAISGISYVTDNIVRNNPNYYQDYMLAFYGEDKFVATIHDKVRSIFVEYIKSQTRSKMNIPQRPQDQPRPNEDN